MFVKLLLIHVVLLMDLIVALFNGTSSSLSSLHHSHVASDCRYVAAQQTAQL